MAIVVLLHIAPLLAWPSSYLSFYFWPSSFRFGSRYNQKCSLFSQKRTKCSRVPSPLTAGLWLWKWWELFSRISEPVFFPVFSYPFLDRFFTYTTCRFQRTTFFYCILKKQTGHIWVAIHTFSSHSLADHCRCAQHQLIKLDRIPSSQPIGKPVILLQTNEKVLKTFQWIFIECLGHNTYFNLLFLRRMLKTHSILIEIILSCNSLRIYVV